MKNCELMKIVIKFFFCVCLCFSYKLFRFFFFSQRVLSYFNCEIFIWRKKAVTQRCSVKKVPYVSRKIHQKIPVLESFLLVKLQHKQAALQRCFRKRCSENMQQIYRRTPMAKCDFNKKLQNNLIEITLWHGCSPLNLLHISRKPFSQEKGPVQMFDWVLNTSQPLVGIGKKS